MASKKKKEILPQVLYVLILTAIISSLSSVDFWGLKKILERQSQQLFFNSIAPTFNHSHSKNILVILFTEDDFEYYGEHWPVPYDFHAEIIERILKFKPKSVFIDLIFEDEKEGSEELEAALKMDENTPIYIGVGRKPPSEFLKRLSKPEKEEGSNIEIVSLLLQSQDAIAYPMSNQPLLEKIDLLNTERYLSLPAKEYCRNQFLLNSKDKSALLKVDEQAFSKEIEKKCLIEFYDNYNSQNFFVTWNNLCYRSFNLASRRCDSSLAENSVLRFVQILIHNAFPRLINGFFGEKENTYSKPEYSIRQKYPSHKTMTIMELNRLENINEVEKAIRGNYIFYGVYIKDGNDLIMPPTHYRLPGVYAHAMAFENHLLLEENITVKGSGFLVVTFTIITSLLLAFGDDLLLVKLSYFNKKEKIERVYRVYFIALYILFSLSVIIIVAMLIPYYYFSMLPLSGFSFAGLVFVRNTLGLLPFLNGVVCNLKDKFSNLVI